MSSPLCRRRASFLVAVAALLALGGCAPTPGVEALRARFVEAGGSCSSWTRVSDPRAREAIRCAEGAVLYSVAGDAERSDIVKTELESNQEIRDRTHIMLSGDDWLIVDRIAVIVKVMPSLHGMIQGRNGANP